jgi:hypothetical protein
MSARAVGYPVQGRNSTTHMTKTDQLTKPPMKPVKTAKKNTSNGILAKNSSNPKRVAIA